MNIKKGKLIIISGPSGVGKGDINANLIADKGLNLTYSVSVTTRNPRVNEVDGVNYHFWTREKFEQALKQKQFLEHVEFLNNYYGTLKKNVEDKLNEGKNVVLEIEVIGATQVLEKMNKEDVISIFLIPPSIKVLEQRLLSRGSETKEIINQRLNKALIEIPLKDEYQYVVENDRIENTTNKIKDILCANNAISNKDPKTSYYFNLKNKVEEIVKRKYAFFSSGWKEMSRIANIIIPKDFNIDEYVVNFLVNNIYLYVLRNEELNILDQENFVESILEYYLLECNFYKTFSNNKK